MNKTYLAAICAILVLIVVAYFWLYTESFQARGFTPSERSYFTGALVGMVPVGDQLQDNQIGQQFGIVNRTLHTKYPLAHMDKPALGKVTVPQLNLEGTMDPKL